MSSRHKNIRYYYWIITGFLKKNIQLIFVSFVLSLVGIITLISFSPYVVNAITKHEEVIGVVGTYDYNNTPDYILSKISNSLVYINENGEIIPVLAESWEQLDGGKEYRFYLKKNLTWTDGTEFTAHDLTYNFKDVKVEIVDDYIIVFKLNKPLPIFPTFLTKPVIKRPLNGVAGLYDATQIKTRFGKITEIYLTPNKDGYPIYQYKFFDTETKLVNAYKLGEIKSLETNNKKIADTFRSWNNTEVTQTVDYSQLLTLFFNTENQLLAEKDVRQSLANAISKKIYEGYGEEALGPIPPTSWAFNPDIKRIQFNPDLAKKIMETYIENDEVTLTISTFYDYLPIAEEIKTAFSGIGIKTNVNLFSYNNSETYDILLAYWRVPQDPDQYFFWHSTQKEGNITNYKNVKIDKLLEDGRETLSVNDRKDIYNNFQKIMMDEVPGHFLYFPYLYHITRK